MRAATDRLMAERKEIRTRGEAAVAIIDSVLSKIPENDQTSRQLALEKLTGMVTLIVGKQYSEPPPHQ